MPAPSLHRVRDSSCTLWWLVVVMENDDTQRDVVLGIFDNNATCSLCKPQLLIYLVLVEPCVIASCSHLHLQHDEPTPTLITFFLDSAVMYMGRRLEPPSRWPSSVVLGKGCALVPLLFAVPWSSGPTVPPMRLD